MGILSFQNYREWQLAPQLFNLPVLFLFTSVNVAVVTYFLFPKIRRPYFDVRQRWWESEPRYILHAPAHLKFRKKVYKCVLEDISNGGAFLRRVKQSPGQIVTLYFNSMNIQATVMWLKKYGRTRGCGVQFIHTDETYEQIQNLMIELKKLGSEKKRFPPFTFEDFLYWITQAFATSEAYPSAARKSDLRVVAPSSVDDSKESKAA